MIRAERPRPPELGMGVSIPQCKQTTPAIPGSRFSIMTRPLKNELIPVRNSLRADNNCWLANGA
jgi:hypothetical protein